MRDIRAITLDLDDTLWPLEPAIEAAEQRLYEWLEKHCPAITATHRRDDLQALRREFAARNPDLQHDVTALRRGFLRELLIAHDYDVDLVDPCFAAFLEARNRVCLFADVQPTLQRLAQHFGLVSVSNGNADLTAIGLDRYFVEQISARSVGAAKPDRRMFLAACDALGEAPEHTLHIGDHPLDDVWGAAQIGMATVWVNRGGADWTHAHRADARVTSLTEVLMLLNIKQ